MRVVAVLLADEDDRFAPDAFDGNLGKRLQVTTRDGAASYRLIEARVRTDGTAAELVLESDQ